MKPCRECPFNKKYEATYPRLGVLYFLNGVMQDDNAPCHLSPHDDDDTLDPLPCAGARLFKQGGHDEVFADVLEFKQARTEATITII